MLERRKKLLLVTGLIVVSVAIFSLFIALGTGKGKTTVYVEVQPADSTLTLDGKVIKAGEVVLTPGKHTFKASREFFDDVSKTIDTADITPENNRIYLLPEANSASALSFLSDNEDVQRAREQVGSALADQEGEERMKRYPILSKLPYKTIDFNVDYGFNDDNSLKLVVTLFPYSQPEETEDYNQEVATFKEEADQFLKDNGIDLAKTDITYKNRQ